MKDRDRLIAKYGLSRNGHAIFSPSGSAGWLNCDAYALVNAALPDAAGPDAAYGTVGHEIAAVWLSAIKDEGRERAEHVPGRFLGFKKTENGHEIECDEIMLHHLRRYIDWCAEVEHLGDVMIEEKTDYSRYSIVPKQGGTADHFVMAPGLLIITDLKMGIGIRVYAKKNTQGMSYALGVFLEWDWLYNFQTIRIRICQPRHDYFGEWECTREELLAFGEEVRAAIKRGWKENAPRTPGPKQCQWCNDKTCVAKSALLADLTGDVFEDFDDPLVYSPEQLDEHEKLAPLFGPPKLLPIPSMSTWALAWRKRHRAMFDAFFKAVDEELMRRESHGEKIPGFKRVLGRRSFSWIDDEKAGMALAAAGLKRSQITVSEIISVKTARDLLRTKGMTAKEAEDFVLDAKVPLARGVHGKPTLAPEADDRLDWSDEIAEVFSDDEGDI